MIPSFDRELKHERFGRPEEALGYIVHINCIQFDRSSTLIIVLSFFHYSAGTTSMAHASTPLPTEQSAGKPMALTESKTILICDYINRLGMSPKEFMVTFLSSSQQEIVYRQRLTKVGMGGRQTRSIFKNLGRLTTSSDIGRA